MEKTTKIHHGAAGLRLRPQHDLARLVHLDRHRLEAAGERIAERPAVVRAEFGAVLEQRRRVPSALRIFALR
jgi:hypothetical protein